MNEHQSLDRNEDRDQDDDQLRGATMNETIREVNGDPDMDLNNIRDIDDDIARQSRMGEGSSTGVEGTGKISGATGGRTSGAPDMDDQTAGGLGLNRDSRESSGNITPKTGMTGSDFDGQVANS